MDPLQKQNALLSRGFFVRISKEKEPLKRGRATRDQKTRLDSFDNATGGCLPSPRVYKCIILQKMAD